MVNKRYILIFIFAFILLLVPNICMAKDLDQINEYNITVDPRNNGTLDIKYFIKWKVLDSDTEGPLEWVKIGIPNSHVDSIKALTNNIKSAKYYDDNGDYIRIDFKNKYYKNDEVEFSFSVHQDYMYELSSNKCEFSFTPGWFDDINVKKINIFWNNKNVLSSNSKKTNSDNYLEWNGSLGKGKKLTAKVVYEKNVFNLDSTKTMSNAKTTENSTSKMANQFANIQKYGIIIFIGIILCYVIYIWLGVGYGSHSGFGYSSYYDNNYDNRYDRTNNFSSFFGSSSHSSCVSSCACACACAGGGRAGCSKKDLYGTNLTTEMLNKVLKK